MSEESSNRPPVPGEGQPEESATKPLMFLLVPFILLIVYGYFHFG